LKEISDNLILNQEITLDTARKLLTNSINIDLDVKPRKVERSSELNFNLASPEDIKTMIAFENVLNNLFKKQWQLT
jgi:hypothetical protein